MKTSITAGLEPIKAKEIEGEYRGSPQLRKRLVELLKAKQQKAYDERIGKSTYDSPNWAFIQADGVGYERAISELISLIFDERNN